jgi:hypothetical protein
MIEYEDPTRSSSTAKTTVSWPRRNWAMKKMLAKTDDSLRPLNYYFWRAMLRSIKWPIHLNEL